MTTSSYDIISDDLQQTNPQIIQISSQPYNDNDKMIIKISSTYEALQFAKSMGERIEVLVYAYYLGNLIATCPPKQKHVYHSYLTTHYIDVSKKVYQLYRITGIEQIYRTRQTTLTMFQKLFRPDLKRLIIEATLLETTRGNI